MEIIKEYGAILASIVGYIVWSVRLEGRVNGNAKDLARLERQLDTDRADAKTARAEQMDMLREVQRDIKTLLGRNYPIQHHTDRTLPPR